MYIRVGRDAACVSIEADPDVSLSGKRPPVVGRAPVYRNGVGLQNRSVIIEIPDRVLSGGLGIYRRDRCVLREGIRK